MKSSQIYFTIFLFFLLSFIVPSAIGAATLTVDGTTVTICGYNNSYDKIEVINGGNLQICDYGTPTNCEGGGVASGCGYANISLGNNGNFTVDATSQVNGTGKGTLGGTGIGGSTTTGTAYQGMNGENWATGSQSTSANGGGGGGGARTSSSYAASGGGGAFGGDGGNGGRSTTSSTLGAHGIAYGSDNSIVLLAGSGGGGGAGDAVNNGGGGGAGLKVDTGNGVINIWGTIDMNGATGFGLDSQDSGSGGGGSGGHVILYSKDINISGGTINANGGKGGSPGSGTTADDTGGGGGGGGRVLLVYSSLTNTSTTINVAGGAAGGGGNGGSAPVQGNAGTLFYNSSPTSFNSPPSTPTNIQCNDNDNCNITVDSSVDIKASGSTDPNSDTITYFIDATLSGENEISDTTDASFIAGGGGGGISHIGSDTTTSSTSLTGLSWSHTLVSGSNRIVIVMVAWENANIDTEVSGVTYGDRTMTAATSEASGNSGSGYEASCQIWYILENNLPSDGSNTVAVTMTGTVSSFENDAIAMEYSGMVQSAPEASTVNGSTTDNPLANTINPSADSWVLSCFKMGNTGDATQNEGQTEILEFDDGSSTSSYAEYGPATGSETSFSTTNSNLNRHGRAAASFAAVPITSEDVNTTETTYSDIGYNYSSINNITVNVEVDSYDPRASVNQGTNDPDLFLEIYDGNDWIGIGNFDLPTIYTGDELDTTNYNFSLTTTDSGILSGWENKLNQDFRIKGIYMDNNGTLSDEINYTNIWVTIDGKGWQEIGSHVEGSELTWDTSSLAEQTCINLRTRAIDIDGSNSYSDYFVKHSCLNISHGAGDTIPPTWNNMVANVTNNTAVSVGDCINISALWTDDIQLNQYVNSSRINYAGSWINGTWTSFSTNNYTNFTMCYPSAAAGGNWTIKIYANDTSGKSNVTGTWMWYNLSQVYNLNIENPLSLTGNIINKNDFNRKTIGNINAKSPGGRILLIIKNTQNSISINSLLARITSIYRPLSQSFSTIGNLKSILLLPRKIVDSLNIDDLANRLLLFTRSTKNGINLGNNLGKLLSFTRSLNNAISLNSVGQRILTQLRQAISAINIGSTITKTFTFVRSLGNGLNVGDGLSRIGSLLRQFGSSLNIGDMMSRTGAFVRGIGNGLNVGDGLSRIGSLLRQFGSSIGITDMTMRAGTFVKYLSDSLNLDNITGRMSSVLRMINGSFMTIFRLSLPTPRVTIQVISKLAIQVTDAFEKINSFVRNIGDAIDLKDITSKILTFIRNLNNSLSITNISERVRTIPRLITENINLSELFSRISALQRITSLQVIINTFATSGFKTVSSIFTMPDYSIVQGEFAEFDINIQNTWHDTLNVNTGIEVYNSTNNLVAIVNSTSVEISSGQYKNIITFLNTWNLSADSYRAEGIVLFDGRTTTNMTKAFNISQATNVQVGNYTNTSIDITQDIPTLVTANMSSTTTANISIILNSSQEGAIAFAEFSSVENQTISGYDKLGKFIDIRASPNITDNLKWYWINISYRDSEVAASGTTESNLRLFFYNENTNSWQQEENSGVNTESNYVWTNVSHFSLFGIYSQAVSQPTQEPSTGGIGGVGGLGTITIKPISTVNVDFVKWNILREVTPSQSIVEGVVVKNKQNTSIENLEIKVSGVPESWVTISPKILDLNGFETKGFTIAISVPQDANYGDYTVSMKVSNGNIDDENFFILRVIKHPTNVITPIVTRVIEIDKNNEKANVNIDVASGERKIDSVEIIEDVPKNLAQSSDDIEFKTTPSNIIQKDPIVQWILSQFGYNEIQRISYSLQTPPEFKSLIYFPIKQINVVGQKIPSNLQLTENPMPTFSPGKNSTFRFTIENLDSVKHTFGFELQLPGGWKSSPKLLKEEIQPGERKSFEITISLPEDANVGIYILRTFYSWDSDTLIRENAVSVTSVIFKIWMIVISVILAIALILALVILVLYKKKKEIIEAERFGFMIKFKLIIKKILRRLEIK
jgi:hypothetical protein